MMTTKVDPNKTPEFKTWLKEILHNDSTKNLCVVFTKKDGAERELYCTLSSSKIPADKQAKASESGTTARPFSEEAIRVFDTEKQEWRSFRWDSVKQVRFDI
jgi:hypothetical protein